MKIKQKKEKYHFSLEGNLPGSQPEQREAKVREIGRENKEKGSMGGTGRKGGREMCEVTEAGKRGRDDGDKAR